jgi:hypothetical protein
MPFWFVTKLTQNRARRSWDEAKWPNGMVRLLASPLRRRRLQCPGDDVHGTRSFKVVAKASSVSTASEVPSLLLSHLQVPCTASLTVFFKLLCRVTRGGGRRSGGARWSSVLGRSDMRCLLALGGCRVNKFGEFYWNSMKFDGFGLYWISKSVILLFMDSKYLKNKKYVKKLE